MIADWLAHHARTRAGHTACIDLGTGRRFTYLQFFERVTRLAGALRTRHGVKPGDRVMVVARNSTDVYEIMFAAWRIGAVFMPVNWRLAPPELEEIRRDGEPALAIADVESSEEDIILSAHFTGVPAHYLRPSIVKAGLDPDALGVRAEKKFDHREKTEETKAWRDIWAAGQGVRAIKRVQTVAELVKDLAADYLAARSTP